MENLLLKYMEGRFRESDVSPKPVESEPLPVITISRETGCSGSEIAGMLAARLNDIFKSKDKPAFWRVVNKEIIEKAAKKLETDPLTVEPYFKGEKKGFFDDMVLSMSKRYYKSDWKIRKTITEVIHAIASHGHVIIVGRAGVVITQDFPKSLHLKLVAPPDWRIAVIQKKHQITYKEATQFVQDSDASRHRLLADFKCEKQDCYLFDATLNCMKLSPDELVKVIIHMMEVKQII